MKIKHSFVTNSSSSSYIISNLSKTELTVERFINEIWDDLNIMALEYTLNKEDFIKNLSISYSSRDFPISPDTKVVLSWGDDDIIPLNRIIPKIIRKESFHVDYLEDD